MFDFITNSIENALNITSKVFTGEDISSKEVAKLISDGLTVASVATLTGYTVDTIQKNSCQRIQ